MTNKNVINHIHTLLWEYTANYVETSEDSKTKLYKIAVENNFSRYNSNCGDTIEQLAEKAGVNRVTTADVVKGRIYPSSMVMEKIKLALGLSSEETGAIFFKEKLTSDVS